MSAPKRQEVATIETHVPVAMTPIERALASGAPPEVWAKMMEVQERWEANQNRKAYDKAMAAALAKLPTIIKDREVSFGNGKTAYSHASLSAIERAVKPVLAEFGLYYRFSTEATERGLTVTCIVSHQDGHSERNSLPAPLDTSGSKNAIQSIGSTQTYLQRYTLMAALGLSAADDDDGHAAGAGAGELLTDDQAEKIKAEIASVGADIQLFYKYLTNTFKYPIAQVEDIRAKDFDRAMNALAAKKAAGSKR